MTSNPSNPSNPSKQQTITDTILLLPSLHHHKQSITLEPLPPLPSNSKTNTNTICPTCKTNQSRYTCPKCSCPYCSAECYRRHSNQCTEDFYREKVNQIWNNEGTNDDGMNDILQREAEEKRTCESRDYWNNDEEEELEELAQQLENDEEEDIILSPRMRQMFEQSISDGSLSHLVRPWVPWWMPDLVTNTNEQDSDEECIVSSQPTLDERILSIPPLESLHNTAKPLQYNTIDLLFSVALTLRLYNGDVFTDPTTACTTLLQTSTILQQDQKLFQSLPEVLTNCNQKRTNLKQIGLCHVSWQCLINDVSILCTNWRLVIKALFAAQDIFQKGTNECKKKGGDKTLRREFGRMEKKIGFYASWCKKYWKEVEESVCLSEEITRWIEEWDDSKE